MDYGHADNVRDCVNILERTLGRLQTAMDTRDQGEYLRCLAAAVHDMDAVQFQVDATTKYLRGILLVHRFRATDADSL